MTENWSRPLRLVLLAVVLVLLGALLWYIRSILEPLIIAAFIAYLLSPAVSYLAAHTKLSRKASVNLVYFLSLGLLIGIPATLTPLLFNQIKELLADILRQYDQLVIVLQKPITIAGYPLNFSLLAARLSEYRASLSSGALPDQALLMLGKTSVGALWAIVIVAAVYYFMSQWPTMRDQFIHSFPERFTADVQELYTRVRKIWMNYLRGQLLLMLIVGVAFTTAWTILGIPGALVLGLIAGFLTLIPDVGPFLAAMLAVGAAWLEGSNWVWMPKTNFIVALITLAVYLVLIVIKNFYVRPVVMGRSVHMHEALVLISILLATVLWGILGALLIVPVLASLGIIFDYLRRRILGMEPFPTEEPFTAAAPPPIPTAPARIAAIKYRLQRRRKG
jgi:predicted PurR-regulated permease PerM